MILAVIQMEEPNCIKLEQEIMVHLMFPHMNKKTVTTNANHIAISLNCVAAGRVHIVIQKYKGLHRAVSYFIIITACLESFSQPTYGYCGFCRRIVNPRGKPARPDRNQTHLTCCFSRNGSRTESNCLRKRRRWRAAS